MPRVIGTHPETGEEITVHLGRFGPYLTMGSLSRSLPEGDEDPLTIGINRASCYAAGRGQAAHDRASGTHPEGGEVVVRAGVRKLRPLSRSSTAPAWRMCRNAAARRPTSPEVTLAEALALLAERGKELPAKSKSGTAAARKTAIT